MNIFGKIVSVVIILIPSMLKILILRLLGAKIGSDCRIGFSYIDVKDLVLGDEVRIGNFNLISKLACLEVKSGGKIGDFNWITGGGLGKMVLGNNTSIRRFHFFEASGNIIIGDNSIVAGRGSLFFTHGLKPDDLDDVRPIIIGDWCYVGASTRFVPGVKIGNFVFIGMGTVVSKTFNDEYILLAGNPSRVVKKIPKNSRYFDRHFLRHAHHSNDYLGR